MTTVFHATGRANLIGEHTDYTDGLVLPAAIDRGITRTGDPGGGRIRLSSDGAEEVVDIAAELDQVGRPPVGVIGSISSELPQGAGLSSSAALEVVVATALCAAADFTLAPLDLAAWCRATEQRAVGVRPRRASARRCETRTSSPCYGRSWKAFPPAVCGTSSR